MKLYLDIREFEPSILDDLTVDGLITAEEVDSNLPQLLIRDGKIIENGKICGVIRSVLTPEDMESLMTEDLSGLKYILVETGDWHIIPLENLIAKLHGIDAQLMAIARSESHLSLLENILELGVDIAVLSVNSNDLVQSILDTLYHNHRNIDLQSLEVTFIEKIGMGDRVCVDTCSILREGEGLLVGSTAAVNILVQAEVLESGFVNPRPFRINAGVVASYTRFYEKTKYLSELKAGDSVMIVDREGRCREELIARVKIERRPLILLRVKQDGNEYPVILQDAETVTIIGPTSYHRVDQIKIGDMILGSLGETGRHFGMAVNETVDER